jgi:hypothetical protein
VNTHLDFYPEDPVGFNVYKLSQSYKWRADLPEDLRVQMVAIQSKHFYLFEPIELLDKTMVVPVYFYSFQGNLFSKCVRPKTRVSRDKDNKKTNHMIIPDNLSWMPMVSEAL